MGIRKIEIFVESFDCRDNSKDTYVDENGKERYIPDISEVYDIESDGRFLFRSCIHRPIGLIVVDNYESSVEAGEKIESVFERIEHMASKGLMEPATESHGMDDYYTNIKIWDDDGKSRKCKLNALKEDSVLWNDIVDLMLRGLSGFPERPCTAYGIDDGRFAIGVVERYSRER